MKILNKKKGRMGFKEKLIGLLLIVIGALPFLIKIKEVGEFFEQNSFLKVLTPGEIVYQIVLIILGVLLIITIRPRVETRR